MSDSASEKNSLALIIEDDYDASIIIESALQMAGFETEIINDGEEALARLADITPALVTLDLHLPRASGAEILTFIRAEERLADIRVMIVSANPNLAETLRSTANLVLIKPVSFSQVHDLAKRLYAISQG